MDLFAQTRQFGDRGGQLVGHIERMRTRKSNPHPTVCELIDLTEQFHKADRRREFPPVGVDRLTQERNLAIPLALQPTDLLHNLLRGPTALTAPSERNYTKGTEVIAPLHDADPGPDPALALNWRVYGVGVAWCSRRRNASRRPSLKQRWNGCELSWTDHEVQVWETIQERLPFLLRDTPADADL